MSADTVGKEFDTANTNLLEHVSIFCHHQLSRIRIKRIVCVIKSLENNKIKTE